MQKIVERLASAEGGTEGRRSIPICWPRTTARSTTAGSMWPKSSAPSGRRCSPTCGNSSSTSATGSGENGPSRSTTKSSTAPRPPTTSTPSTSCGKWPRNKGNWAEKTDDAAEEAEAHQDSPGTRQGLDAEAIPLAEVERRSREGNGQRRPRARLGQHLDAADHQSHRHAGHRRADDDRREGLRQQPRPDPEGFRRGGRGPEKRAGGGGRRSRPECKGKGYLEIKPDRDRASPLRRERRRYLGRGRGGPGRQGDYDDGRRPRAVPRAGPLRPQPSARTRKTSRTS